MNVKLVNLIVSFCIFLCFAVGRPTTQEYGCHIELQSFGSEDSGWGKNGFIGSISVGHVNQPLSGFARVPFTRNSRGLFVVTMWKPGETCEVIQSAVYDTCGYSSAAASLDAHLRSLRPGSVIAGICSDECMQNLTPAKAAFHSWGINFQSILGAFRESIWWRSSLAFIARKGRPWDTRMIQLPRKYGPATLKYVIKD